MKILCDYKNNPKNNPKNFYNHTRFFIITQDSRNDILYDYFGDYGDYFWIILGMTLCVGRNLSHENRDHNQPKWCDYVENFFFG